MEKRKKQCCGSYQGNYCLEATDSQVFSKCSQSQFLFRCPSHAIYGPSSCCEISVAGHTLHPFTFVAFSLTEVNTHLNTFNYLWLFSFQKSFLSKLLLDSERSQCPNLVFNILLLLLFFSQKKKPLKTNAQF